MRFSTKTTVGLLAAAVTTLGAGTAMADTVVVEEDYWPASGYGIGVSVGAGVADFADRDMRATTDTGGMWDLRVVVGTRTPIALEGAYVGTAQSIDSRFSDQHSATLIGTGVEGALRVNLIPFEQFTPYALAGLGYKRYDVRGQDFRTADTGVADEDTLLEVPLGAGLSYRYEGFIADARFTYRIAAGEDLVISQDGIDDVDVETDPDALGLDNWAATARVGWEF